eukprot:g77476.t1
MSAVTPSARTRAMARSLEVLLSPAKCNSVNNTPVKVIPGPITNDPNHHLGVHGRHTPNRGHGPFSTHSPGQQRNGSGNNFQQGTPHKDHKDGPHPIGHHLGQHGRAGGHGPFAGGAPSISPDKHAAQAPSMPPPPAPRSEDPDIAQHHHLGHFGRAGHSGLGPYATRTPTKSPSKPEAYSQLPR